MIKYTLSFVVLIASSSLCGQTLTGLQVLDNAIAYHDPNGQWETFSGTFHVRMETPDNPDRNSKITIDLPNEYFFVEAKRDKTTTQYVLSKGDCTIKLNGSSDLSEEQKASHNLNCDRAAMYKNYYTYLYGLPMKLKDPGTIISGLAERKTFKGKEYLVIEARYDRSVGSDVWYFYFDPASYAMEIYQFFKTDNTGSVKTGSGEYIILSGEESINGINMPKTRAWYYNKDDKYLGTDILQN